MVEFVLDNKDAVFTYEQFLRWINPPYFLIPCPFCSNEHPTLFVYMRDSSFSCSDCKSRGMVIFNENDIIFKKG